MSQATTPLHISIGPRVRKSPFYAATLRYGDQLWERVMAAGKRHNIAPTAPSTIRSIEGGLLSYLSDKNPG